MAGSFWCTPPPPLQVELAAGNTDSFYKALIVDFSLPHGDYIYDDSTILFPPSKEFSCNSPWLHFISFPPPTTSVQ